MLVSTARNVGAIASIESIDMKKIPEADLEFLIRETSYKKVLAVEIPKGPADFSRPMWFFVQNRTKFIYLRRGKLLPPDAIATDDEYFIAFKIKKQKMFSYGYFPGETD